MALASTGEARADRGAEASAVARAKASINGVVSLVMVVVLDRFERDQIKNAMNPNPPPPKDQRPGQRTNDTYVILLVQASVWTVLGVVLWGSFQADVGSARAAVMTTAILAVSAASIYSAIGLESRRRPWRWHWVAGSTASWGGAGHLIFGQVGLRQSLVQDLINVVTVTGVGLALHLAWSSYRAQQREVALRQEAELRLAASRLRPVGKLVVRVGHKEVMLDPEGIRYVSANGNFTILHGESEVTFASESLKDLMSKLAAHGFVRIHKSHAVNPLHIRERRPEGVTLVDHAVLPIGRAYRSAKLALLSGL